MCSVKIEESKTGNRLPFPEILFPVSLYQSLPASADSQQHPTSVQYWSTWQPGPLSQIKCRKAGSYNVKLKDDSTNCWITGIAITKDGRRLLADNYNNKLKVLSRDMKFLSSLSLSDGLRDIAVISDQEAVVTTSNKSLVILSIPSNQIYTKTTTTLSFDVWGITKFKDKLAITSVSPRPCAVKLIDHTGRVYWSVSSDQQVRSLFHWPYYLNHSEGTSNITVTDGGNNTMTLLDGDTGAVISRRQVTGKSPYGVTTDTTGNVYVCYDATSEISVMSADFCEDRILLSKKNGLRGSPQAIGYDGTTHCLVVSYFGGANNIDCYKLS